MYWRIVGEVDRHGWNASKRVSIRANLQRDEPRHDGRRRHRRLDRKPVGR